MVTDNSGGAGRGNSFANGPVLPWWARNWQFRQLWEARMTWENM